MRSNSGQGKGQDNLHDPTLREHEREKGKSGEAALKEKRGARQSPEVGPAGHR